MSGQAGQTPSINVLESPSLSSAPPSLWDRVSLWASENKTVVYSIAGVAVVITGAGVVYYLSDSRKPPETAAPEEKKKSSKKRKAQKEKKKIEPDVEKAESPAVPKEAPGKSSLVEMEYFPI